MSRAAILSFSEGGARTALRVASALPEGWESAHHTPKGNLKPLTAELFPANDALIFVGACGIAVRAIAPLVVSKASDPAVLVIDERGQFVISLLSGHIGGANDLAVALAAGLGATPVVTTATDVRGRFSADAWAARHNCAIESLAAAKRFSSEILRRDLPFQCDFPVEGALPAGLAADADGDVGLAISLKDVHPFETTLLLMPRIVHIGIGCKRGISADAIDEAVTAAFDGSGLRRETIKSVSSIDVKRDEAGLKQWAEDNHLALSFYSADELNALPGDFTASAFVKSTVGVDNVCERSALMDAGEGGQIIIRKTSRSGVTVAAAAEKWSVSF